MQLLGSRSYMNRLDDRGIIVLGLVDLVEIGRTGSAGNLRGGHIP
jgi:hypothetical protein